MAIAFRQVASHSTNAETLSPHDILISKPTGTLTDDVMVAFIQTQGNVNAFDAVPAGWTEVTTVRTPTTSNAGVFMGAWWKRAAAGEGASYTWSLGASAVFSGAIVSFSGCSTSGAVVASGSTTSDLATDLTVGIPSITAPTTANWLVTGHGLNPSATSGVPITFTSTMTERFDSTITDDGTTLRASMAVYTKTLTAAGAIGTQSATCTNDGRNIGIGVVLAPPQAVAAGGAGWFRTYRGNARSNGAVQAGSVR